MALEGLERLRAEERGELDREFEAESQLGLPSYLVAADNHSRANDNQTFLEGAAETVSNIPQFLGVSLLSGANQLYNIAPTLGNFMGGDFELSKTADVIESLDEDLGMYYQEHQESADVAGFLISSIIPGLGGMKLLNAGQKALATTAQTGRVGNGFARGFGLMRTRRDDYLKQAIKEVTNSNSLSLVTNRNTALAMANGYGQAVLEMAAFETATAVTLADSPMLKDHDIGDMVANIAIGGFVFGTFGGVWSAAKANSAVKAAVNKADIEAAPWVDITELHKNSPSSSKLIHFYEQMKDMKQVPLVFTSERLAFIQGEAKTKMNRLEILVRKELGNLAEDDQIIASQAFAMSKGTDFVTNLGNYLGATKISRVLDKSVAEKTLLRIDKKLAKGKGTIDELNASVDAKAEINFGTSYVTTWGEGIGNTVEHLPQHKVLADTLTKGQEIVVKGGKVTAGKKKYEFSVKKADKKGLGYDVTKGDLLKSQARHIWALESDAFVSAKALEAGKFKPVVISENDPALLDKLYREFNPAHGVKTASGEVRTFADKRELLDFIHTRKVQLAVDLVNTTRGAAKGFSHEDIASTLNLRSEYLAGAKSDNLQRDLFALQSYSEDYTQVLINKGLHTATDDIVPVYKLPRQLKVSYDTSVIKDLDGNILEGMAVIKQQQSQQANELNNVTSAFFKEDVAKLLNLTDDDILRATRRGSGGKFFSAASSNYGTLAAKMEWLGKVTASVIQKKQDAVRTALESDLVKLNNNQAAVVEWSNLNATLRSIPESYVLTKEGGRYFMEPRRVAAYKAALAEGKKAEMPVLRTKDAPMEIPLKNAETIALARRHIEVNGIRNTSNMELRAVQGLQNERDSAVFYPTPVDPKEFPHFAIVKDSSITGTGHSKTIYAATEDDLIAMTDKLADEPTLKVLFKQDAEDYYRSIGQFDNARSLNENYLDITMHRKGVSSPYYVPTDGQKITSDLLSWHLKEESSLVREMVSAKYERQFNELRKRGEQFTKKSTSTFSSLSTIKHAENVVKNPFMDYVKTALSIRNYSDYPFWVSANKLLDSKVSEMYGKISNVFKGTQSDDAALAEVNSLMKEYGYKGAAYDMEMDLLANHAAPKGALINFVQKGNAVLATSVLRLDFMNAAVNAISANILYGAEMKAVMRAIGRGDEAAVGELAALSKIKVPGTNDFTMSPAKMMADSIRKFGTDTPEMQFFREQGYVTNLSDQYKNTLDHLTLNGKETVRDLESKIGRAMESAKKFADKGERITGNRLAEEFNRFNAAHTMKQVTDIAVKHNLMDEKTALSYINTFVNRTQGNYLASQRPMLFQGAIGQSIGLFQTYQFNLMQQLLRHAGEGVGKDSATLLGLQGTVFGLNGLPAFNAINTHIVGTASGNKEHKDFYTTAYGAAGKDAGDWLMYGLASNMLLHPDLKTNIYVRGDINPRHLTIIPTSPADVAIVQASAKFFGNLFEVGQKVGDGGNFWSAILQGIEHNGISRPLAGLAQTLQGIANPLNASFSTSKRGNVIGSNDILSLTNFARMAGGKPLGEAIAIDASYRFKAYSLRDSKKRSQLGEAIKSNLIAGRQVTREQVEEFSGEYAKLGGKQGEFNKFVIDLHKTANTSQANELRRNLNSPYAKSMQLIMGGYELKDFTN